MLKKLFSLVVHNALHTGDVRTEPLGCHEGTREAILLNITTWLESRLQAKGVLWIVGPVGIVKSAIAMTTAQLLSKPRAKAKVAASFFFFRGNPDCSSLYLLAAQDEGKLVGTLVLAY